MNEKPKLVRITTIPISIDKLLHNQLRFMQQYFNVIAVSSNKHDLKQVANSQGVAYKAIDMSRKITPFKDFIALLKLIVFLLREKPQIVHTHTPKAGIIGMLAAKIVGVPNRLHTVAGLPLMEAKGFKRFVLNAVERLCYYCATHVYPNSKGLHDFIIGQKLTNSKKIRVIGNGSSNGIDTTYFDKQLISIETQNSLRNELNIAENDFVFVFVGRLVSDKGINELVEAFIKFQSKNIQSKLLLVGPLEPDLDPLNAETLHQIQHHPNIISIGYKADVRPYFAISDCLVFPSYREGFPNVVIQAGAMNLPVIASNINGCNEIIIPNVNGILIDVKKYEPIIDAMDKMLNKNIYSIFLNNSRKLIVQRYEQKYIWEQILNEYKNLMSNV